MLFKGQGRGKGELPYVTSDSRLACPLKGKKKHFISQTKGGLKWRQRWIWNLRPQNTDPTLLHLKRSPQRLEILLGYMNERQGRVEVMVGGSESHSGQVTWTQGCGLSLKVTRSNLFPNVQSCGAPTA